MVLPGYCEPEVLKSLVPPDSQLLTLTPMAMSVAEDLDLPFSTPDDFYGVKEYRQDLADLNGTVEVLFHDLDRICQDMVGFPLAYSATIYWFQVIFADLLFLTRLSDRINQRYQEISVICASQEMGWGQLGYRDLERPTVTHTFENKIKLLPHIMNAECLDPGNQGFTLVPAATRYISFMKRVPRAIKRRVIENGVQVSRRYINTLTHKPCIFVIHSGFELNNLRSKLSDYTWIDPIAQLNEHMLAMEPVEYGFDAIRKRLHSFLSSTFQGFSPYLELLFSRFHLEVIGRLGYWKVHLEKMLSTLRPKALFYSVSANTLPAAMIAHMADNSAIPIFNFQHGGTSVFTKHPYQKYLEMNENFKKILILCGKAEEEQAQHTGSQCYAFGSSTRYKLLKKEKSSKNNRLLYCCGIMPYFTYKELFFNLSDAQYFKSSNEILCAARENSIHIDVKLHPADEKYGYTYFSNLIKSKDYRNARVIYGTPAESVIMSYGLIVLEYLNSAIASTVFGLKIPIILYLKDLSFVQDFVLKDLESRCHIIQDYTSLVKALKLYKANALARKWTEDFIDRYIYPIVQEDPAVKISRYIRQVIDKV